MYYENSQSEKKIRNASNVHEKILPARTKCYSKEIADLNFNYQSKQKKVVSWKRIHEVSLIRIGF